LALLFFGASPPFPADQNLTFKIPPVKIPLNVKEQHLTLLASAVLTFRTKAQGMNTLSLELTADLSDLQRNVTELLRSALPPDAQGYAAIQKAQFKDDGSGHLLVRLTGEIRITNDQIQALSKQVKDRLAAHP